MSKREVGQVFERINKPFDKADIGDLYVLDDTDENYWIGLSGRDKGERVQGFDINNMKRIYPPEEPSKDVTVTCEGHEVTISRESAINLGLCK